MAYIVNSSPGAGLRFEAGKTLADPHAALAWALGLSERGMRLVRIRDVETGQVLDVRQLRDMISRQEAAS